MIFPKIVHDCDLKRETSNSQNSDNNGGIIFFSDRSGTSRNQSKNELNKVFLHFLPNFLACLMIFQSFACAKFGKK